jgi:hypothetical protein
VLTTSSLNKLVRVRSAVASFGCLRHTACGPGGRVHSRPPLKPDRALQPSPGAPAAGRRSNAPRRATPRRAAMRLFRRPCWAGAALLGIASANLLLVCLLARGERAATAARGRDAGPASAAADAFPGLASRMPGVHPAGGLGLDLGLEQQTLAAAWRAWLGRQHARAAPSALHSIAAAAAGRGSDADQQPGPPPAAAATRAATTAARVAGSEVRLRPQEDALAAAALAAGAAAEPFSEQVLKPDKHAISAAEDAASSIAVLPKEAGGAQGAGAAAALGAGAALQPDALQDTSAAGAAHAVVARAGDQRLLDGQAQAAAAASAAAGTAAARSSDPSAGEPGRLSVFALPAPVFAAWPWWEGFSCISLGHVFKVIAQCTQPLSKVYA